MGCNLCSYYKKTSNLDEIADIITDEEQENIKHLNDSPKMRPFKDLGHLPNSPYNNMNAINIIDEEDKVIKTEVLDSIVTSFEKGRV